MSPAESRSDVVDGEVSPGNCTPTTTAGATNGAHRARAALVGALFITSTVTFAIGSAQINTYFEDGSKSRSALAFGVLLEAYTAIAVVGIALALLPLLLLESKQMARGYVALRSLECAAILGAGAVMLAADKELSWYENLVYVFSGVGGILLALLLLRSGLTRRWIALLGLVGYPVLLLGVLADMVGVVDLGSNAEAVFFVPGGLFEIILPLQLLAFGFSRAPGPDTGWSAE